ncbi:MAG: hypothetical protein LC107_12245 [Chitinophagales bacterium]|nr:hypothetical protein [Chitinophagales bacterium]
MEIQFNSNWYNNALEEQRERAPHMMTKFADTDARKAGQIRGLVIEHHVSGWFKDQYPHHYREADNYRQWTQFCSHDFKLVIHPNLYNIDVSGPKKDGSFGSYKLKPNTNVHFHILCAALGFAAWDNCDFTKGFKILGVVNASDYLVVP